MYRRPRDCRVAEWAELVGEDVPEVEATLDADRGAPDRSELPGDETR